MPPIGSRSIFNIERGPRVVRMMSATACGAQSIRNSCTARASTMHAPRTQRRRGAGDRTLAAWMFAEDAFRPCSLFELSSAHVHAVASVPASHAPQRTTGRAQPRSHRPDRPLARPVRRMPGDTAAPAPPCCRSQQPCVLRAGAGGCTGVRRCSAPPAPPPAPAPPRASSSRRARRPVDLPHCLPGAGPLPCTPNARRSDRGARQAGAVGGGQLTHDHHGRRHCGCGVRLRAHRRGGVARAGRRGERDARLLECRSLVSRQRTRRAKKSPEV